MITVLIETGVNKHKAYKIKGKLHLKGMFMNNYQNHENGRFWIWWNNKKVEVRKISSSMQNIHCGVYDLQSNFLYWLTAIYGLNYLEKKKKLWYELEQIHLSQHGPWFLIGDFNNVLKAMDMSSGNLVQEKEYKDIISMMNRTNLSEMDTGGGGV
ncbi:hypothetical protein KIW84_034334 [Lathyrus oleraceus]|uniref:Uncharacterized protein n=1 Tax=Pisum sativum TaxID=3888 RepID=A0A9D4XYA7_PEA|nr:hypothetical protein KIW84_034334 [Pisum sativum]